MGACSRTLDVQSRRTHTYDARDAHVSGTRVACVLCDLSALPVENLEIHWYDWDLGYDKQS